MTIRTTALAALAFPLTLLLASPALAQTEDPAAASLEEEEETTRKGGYQFGLRSGYSIPFGSATGASGDDLSRTFGGQVPIIVTLGYKGKGVTYIGGYVGMAFGGEGSSLDYQCRGSVSCSTLSFRGGIELLLQLPATNYMDFWFGYGVGLESSTFSASGPGGDGSVSLFGIDFARLGVGLDFRVAKSVIVGPALDAALGSYFHYSTDAVGGGGTSGFIEEQGLHGWMTFGARVAFVP